MGTTCKLIAIGMASLVMAVGALALPLSHSANALSLDKLKEPEKVAQLATQSNGDVDLSTELNCSTHTLTAVVKNNTSASITPNVTFNDKEPTLLSRLPIEPGRTGRYFYHYSGNNMFVTTKAQGEGFASAETSSTLNCMEPVSFKVKETSDSGIVPLSHKRFIRR